MWQRVLGEFLGTLVLVLLGNGANYSVSGKRFFANQSGKWIIVVFGWALAVLAGIIVAQSFNSPAHLNPAISIYSSISTKDYEPIVYIPFQFLGAISAQIVLNFINWKHICETDLVDVRSAHCTAPAFSNKKDKATIFNFSYELIGTIILIAIVWSLSNGTNLIELSKFSPIFVSLIILSIGISLGSSTGYAINPARDLGPRFVYFVFEKTILKSRKAEWIGANFSYGWIPALSPAFAGAIMGSFALI